MRSVALLSGAALCASVLTACDSQVTEPPFLPETSPTPAEEGGFAGFRTFAGMIEQAVTSGDGSILEERAQRPSVPFTAGDIIFGHTPEELAAQFNEFVSEAQGGARLYAIAQWKADLEGQKLYEAVITPTDSNGSQRILAHQFVFRHGRWRVVAATVNPNFNPFDTGESVRLTGECSECYDHWERWEGTP